MLKESLVENARKGSQRAYKELFDNNVNNLYRYLRQFSNDSDQVEDWVQRAFIKAFNNLYSFQGGSSFRTWLFKIAINEMRTDFRKKSSRSFEDYDENNITEYEENGSEMEWNDEMKWLLLELDEIKKSVFILYEVEGYNHYEIADLLNISVSSSKTILHRTKKSLQERWQSIKR